MRRLWVAGILLVIMISLCALGIFQVTVQSEKVIDTINSAMQAAEQDDFDRAYEIISQCERDWIKTGRSLAAFTSHLELNNVGVSLAKLPPLIKSGEKSAFLSECAYSIVRLKHLAENELPLLNNLL